MEPGFLSFVTHIKGVNYHLLLQIFCLIFSRLAPVTAIAPFLGAKVIPTMGRVGVALSLTTIFLPNVLVYLHTTTTEIPTYHFLIYLVKEICLGFVLGIFISSPFFIMQSAGILIDYIRGSSVAIAQDMVLQSSSSPLGLLFNKCLIVFFYSTHGPFFFFEAFLDSFESFPVDTGIPITFFYNEIFWKTCFSILGYIFMTSIELTAPSLLAVLMAELFLGIANRLAPQVPVALLGLPLKSFLGLLLLTVSWFSFIKKSSYESVHWIQIFRTIFLVKS